MFPALQFGRAGIRLEERAWRVVLDAARAPRCHVGVASAYLNPPADLLAGLAASPARVELVAPSLAAHGFSGAPDVRAAVPLAYQLVAADVARTLRTARCDDAASTTTKQLLEWRDDEKGYTFHAKGAWLLANGAGVLATLVGSSNFNVRARRRDLELSFLLVTTNARLRSLFTREWRRYRRRAMRSSAETDEDDVRRRVPFWVLVFRRFINTFL